jgi:uncharacterized membrane protein YdbT with pleckstrin-like domain
MNNQSIDIMSKLVSQSYKLQDLIAETADDVNCKKSQNYTENHISTWSSNKIISVS